MDIKDMSALDRKMASDIEQITAEFAQGHYQARLSEEAFTRSFLPMFAEDPNRDPRINVMTWLHHANGPFNEVAVFDANDQLLYMVPPLFDRSYIKPLDGSGKEANMSSLTHVMLHAEKLGKRGANAMNNYIDAELAARSFMFGERKINAEHAKRWADIFARYNLTPPAHFLHVAEVAAVVQGGAPAVDYDML